MSNFWKKVISSKDTTSSKRLITLIVSGHFIVSSFAILIFYLSAGHVNKDIGDLLKDILKDDFYIILAGLGFITGENLASILLEKAKVEADTTTTVAGMNNDKDNCRVDNPDKP